MEASRFTPNATQVLGLDARSLGKGKYAQATCNPTKTDVASFGYLPYLTLYKALRAGGLVTELRVQFSASKVILGNNFDEIGEDDFEAICNKIYDGLAYLRIMVRGGVETIINAHVDVVHYSKNFVIDNFMSAREVTMELEKVDVNSWRDVSKTDFINDSINNGHGIKVHSKNFELAFYDKLAEYQKGKRGQPTFDTDTQQAFDLFSAHKIKQPFEVVRMEVRLGNGKTIRQVFERADIDPGEQTFRDLFNSMISKKVLQWYLADLYDHFPKITEASTDDALKLLSNLYVQNPDRQISTILAAIGLATINKNDGLRAIKDVVGSKGSSALLRLAKKINSELSFSRRSSEVFELLDRQLDRFEPIHLKDFEK